MLDLEDQVKNQVNGGTDSFQEFFAGYSNDDNPYAILTTSRHNTHLLVGDIIELSSDVSYILLEKDLFKELFDSDLLKFTCQKAHKLSNIERI